MKILFIFKSENFIAPRGLSLISAVAKKSNNQTYLCELNSQDPFKSVLEITPDVIAYSSSTGEAKHYLKINSELKEKYSEIVTIMGGPHPTFFPEVVNEGNLDAVCVGEGEGAFADFLDAVSCSNSFEEIENIVTKRNVADFTVRNLIEDLDSLPFPDFGLLYDNTPMGRYPMKSIMTSRGCPYSCSYCFNAAWRDIYKDKGSVIRRHSVDYVIDEIKHVRNKWPLSFVKFYDDSFVYKTDEWLEEFSEKYKKEIDLPFFILARADLLTEDSVKLLKVAGCRTISMSIEAGKSEIRERLLKRYMSNDQILKAHKLCQKYGIYTFTNCIIGLPETNIKDDLESLELAIRCKVDWAEFPIFYPYPRTWLGVYTVNQGLYDANFDNMHTSYQYRSPLNCFTKKEKNVQMNLAVLGPVAVVFPGIKNFIINFLIYMKHNVFFTLVYYIVKMYILRKKIYVTKASFWNSIMIFIKSLKQELFKHENKRG